MQFKLPKEKTVWVLGAHIKDQNKFSQIKTRSQSQTRGKAINKSVIFWITVLSSSLLLFQNCGGRTAAFSEISGKVLPLTQDQQNSETESSESEAETVAEEIVTQKMECPDDPTRDCMVICHVPPGNPDKAKTMILPLPAIAAHFQHGNHDDGGHDEDDNDEDDGDHDHRSKDYYGACL